MHMPNVFVHPPEEDQEEPYCCFDAASPSTPPTTLNDLHIIHPFNSSPSSSSPTRSVLDAYQNIHHAHHDDYHDDWDDHVPTHFDPHPPPLEEDSEVIEVVRVRKSRSTLPQHTFAPPLPPSVPLKRASSFKSKASKAFRSLAGSLRGSKVSQVPQPVHIQDSTPVPTLSRRGSTVLSQLFSSNSSSTTTSLKSRASIASFDRDPDPPLTSPTSSTFSGPPTDTVISPPSSRRSSLYAETIPHELVQLRSPSPTPSTTSRRTFSRINLRKMFSFSSASISTASSGRTTPTHTSSSGPQTPTSTDSPDPPNEITPRSSRTSRHCTPAVASFDTPLDFDFAGSSVPTDMSPHPRPSDPDVSFEMRLDSLHFDDLSFDADKFIVS